MASGALMRRHFGFALLAAVAIPAVVAFCWHSVVATLGDDSVSYLLLARHFSPWHPDPLAAPWVPYFSNFPPLFPLLLAVTGGGYDLFVGHMVVAAGAVASLLLTYAYARERMPEGMGALAVTALFLLMPGMWLGLVGILSESTYLALSLAALLYEARRLRPESGAKTYVVFGLLLAAAMLSRVAGVALVAAYAARLGVEAVRQRRFPTARTWLPILIPAAAQLAWLGLRPSLASPAYQNSLGILAEEWLLHPAATFATSWSDLSRGWIGVFAADSAGSPAAALPFALVAVAALAGAVRAARRARLDGWYVLASVAMLLAWKFNEDNARRLFFPLLPLMLLHATESVRALAGMFGALLQRWTPTLAFVFLAIMLLPATGLILRKALDRDPYFPGLDYRPASAKDYYGIVNAARARAAGLSAASVLGGFSSLDQWTPHGARVMWVRPEYIAILGKREGVPLYLLWDRATLAREILRTRTDFVILSQQFKNDLATYSANVYQWLALDPPDYLIPVTGLPDTKHADFTLLRVDPERLHRYIRDTEGAPPGPPGPSQGSAPAAK